MVNDNNKGFEFGIQDTMEVGMGSQELLRDLLEPNAASADPSKITPIASIANNDNNGDGGNDDSDDAGGGHVDKSKTARTTSGGITTIAPTDPKKVSESVIQNFLQEGTDDDDDNNDDDDDAFVTPGTTPKNKKTSNTSQSNDDDNDNDGDGDDDDLGKNAQGQFSALTSDLLRLGVFNLDEDEKEEDVISSISDPHAFLERFNYEKKRGASEMIENFLGQFGEDYRNAFEAIYVKGVDPKEYFKVYNTVVNFAEMDLNEEVNQIAVMRQSLRDQGFDEEDTESEIERLKNYGDLASVAQKNHKVLVRREAQKLDEIEKASEQQLQQKAAIRNQYISNVQSILQEKMKTKEFDGIPLNSKLANELQEFLLVDKWKTPTGELLSDFDKSILELKKPENHSQKVKIALLMKILEKDPTLSTIQKTGVTKKSNQLFGDLARQQSLGKGKGGFRNSDSRASDTGGQNRPSWFADL